MIRPSRVGPFDEAGFRLYMYAAAEFAGAMLKRSLAHIWYGNYQREDVIFDAKRVVRSPDGTSTLSVIIMGNIWIAGEHKEFTFTCCMSTKPVEVGESRFWKPDKGKLLLGDKTYYFVAVLAKDQKPGDPQYDMVPVENDNTGGSLAKV